MAERQLVRVGMFVQCGVLSFALSIGAGAARTRAQVPPLAPSPATFEYTTPAEKNYVRALLEVSVVLGVGFMFSLTKPDAAHDYKPNYRWSVFRAKLLGQALALDLNKFGTNFGGHPLGGTSYYLMARGNRLAIPEAFGIAVGGSLVWELFGEIGEIISINDMIVTPLAGLAIGESLTQLGAFFDRSGDTPVNRALGVIFSPFKSLNDLFDGKTPARARATDAHGFPRDEWHRFDLDTGAALTWQTLDAAHRAGAGEWRFALDSQLARLPAYDGAGLGSLVFDDGNLSNIDLAGAVGAAGLVDFRFATSVVLFGHYARDASLDAARNVRGHGVLIGWPVSFQYTMHDYVRDGRTPIDRIATVSPIGFAFEHRGGFGALQLRTRFTGSGEFGGVKPVALSAYRQDHDLLAFPQIVRDHGYYFAVGARFAGSVAASVGPFEAEANAGFEIYEEVGSPAHLSDQRNYVGGRLSCALPISVARIGTFVERRGRSGAVETIDTQRAELGMGLEVGARL